MRQGWAKNALVYLLILVAVVALFYNLITPQNSSETVDVSKVASQINVGNVDKIEVDGNELTVYYNNSTEPVRSLKESNVGLPEFFSSLGLTPDQIASANIECFFDER